MLAHGAVASKHLDKNTVERLLTADDWRSVEVAPRLRATLGHLERLTLEPQSVTRATIDEALSSGSNPAALEQASLSCFVFSVINRLVDSFGADVTPNQAEKLAAFLDRMGTALTGLGRKPKPWVRYAGTVPAPLVTQLEQIRTGAGDAPAEIRRNIEARVAGQAGAPRPEAGPVPAAVADLVDTIARDAHAVTDGHIERLKADSWSEEAIYELVFVASFSAGLGRLERAIHLLADA